MNALILIQYFDKQTPGTLKNIAPGAISVLCEKALRRFYTYSSLTFRTSI